MKFQFGRESKWNRNVTSRFLVAIARLSMHVQLILPTMYKNNMNKPMQCNVMLEVSMKLLEKFSLLKA